MRRRLKMTKQTLGFTQNINGLECSCVREKKAGKLVYFSAQAKVKTSNNNFIVTY